MISTPVGIFARIRAVAEILAGRPVTDDVNPVLNDQAEQVISPGSAYYQEIIRSGGAVKIGTVAAVAAVVAVPTTAAMLSLYNNEPDGGKTMIIDWLAALNIVSTAVISQAQILALIGTVKEAAPVDAALPLVKLNGNGVAGLNIRSVLAATALPATTGLAANWFPVGSGMLKPSPAATPGYGGQVPIDGRIMVPPGRFFAMHVMANVVGETFCVFAGVHMKQLNLG